VLVALPVWVSLVLGAEDGEQQTEEDGHTAQTQQGKHCNTNNPT